MYCILKKTGTDSENLWSYYTEKGVVFTTDDLAVAAAKLQELLEIVPVGNLRLIEEMDVTVAVTAVDPTPPVTPEPEPETEPETP